MFTNSLRQAPFDFALLRSEQAYKGGEGTGKNVNELLNTYRDDSREKLESIKNCPSRLTKERAYGTIIR